MVKHLLTFFKGLIVGGTMLVPGVSGGSMAIILGIYDRLVSSVSSFFKHKKQSIIFLALFAVGGGLGVLLFAKPLGMLIENYHLPTMYFFIGAVAGGVPLMVKQAQIKRISWTDPLLAVIGFGAVMALNLLPESAAYTGSGDITAWLLGIISGIIAAVALVLPGISVSFLLLVLGMYDPIIKAINSLDVMFLLPIFIGLVLGIILTTKLLEKAMTAYPRPTYMIILGFIIGSVVQVFPGLPSGWDIAVCILTLAAGFAAIYVLSHKAPS